MAEQFDIVSWDLECSSLNADYGIILCAGFKTVGKGRAEILSISDYPSYSSRPWDDKQLCIDIAKRLNDADCWLTQFGTFYDVKFLNTRLVYHKLPPINPAHLHIDLWRTAKNRLKLRNNRLVTVQEFLELPTEKDSVLGPIWIKAVAGHKPSLQYVVNHCRKDVKVLEEAYLRLRALIVDHPRLDRGECKVCGSDRLQARGYHRTLTNRYQRFQCLDCGRWSRSGTPLRKTPLKEPRPI